jgi:hypothetical protein
VEQKAAEMKTVPDPVFISFCNSLMLQAGQVPIRTVMATTLTLNSGTLLNERRRRSRLKGETLGWILPVKPQYAMHLPTDDEGWEVRVYNVSRFGVGFSSTESLQLGSEHRLRIGRGPMSRARLIRVIVCRQIDNDSFSVGAEFVDISTRGLSRAG